MPYRFETLQVHAGQEQADPTTKARAVPIYQTTAFNFDDADHAARLFALQEFGNIYSRIMNPTNDVLERRLTALEGGAAAVAVASGHAAEFITFTTLAEAGDTIVASPNLYGGTHNMLSVRLPKLGITTRFLGSDDDPSDVARLIDDTTKAVYLESIPNPSLHLPDLDAIARIAHERGVAVVVDNTSAMGGYLYRPFEHGADVIVHSATKWINGHGTGIGGLIVDGGTFDWNTARYPGFSQPSAGYHGMVFGETFGVGGPFGNIAFAIRARVEGLRDIGAALAPQNAFLFLQGLETLSLRADRQVENTQKLAEWLTGQQGVFNVNYPGLAGHPQHAFARRALPARRRRHPHVRGRGRAAGGQDVPEQREARIQPREPGRRQDQRDAPRQHHPLAARGGGAARGGDHARAHPRRAGHRAHRRPARGLRPGAARVSATGPGMRHERRGPVSRAPRALPRAAAGARRP